MTTAASRFLAYGDFQQFVIVDRVGSTLEILPGYGARLHQLSRLGARQRSWAMANDLGQVRELLIKLRSPTGEHKGGSVLKPVGPATGRSADRAANPRSIQLPRRQSFRGE
jgi:hypothetical protein